MSNAPKTALVLVYPFNEENEVIIGVTVLRKGGLTVTLAGPDRNPVTGSRGMKIVPDTSLAEAVRKGPYDVVVLAGGAEGWRALSEDPEVGKLLREQERCDRLISAICTSPVAMLAHGVMYGKKLTSYPHPRVEAMVRKGDKYIYKYDDVVIDGKLVTSKGNFTSFHWALKTLEVLTDRQTAVEAAQEMLVECRTFEPECRTEDM